MPSFSFLLLVYYFFYISVPFPSSFQQLLHSLTFTLDHLHPLSLSISLSPSSAAGFVLREQSSLYYEEKKRQIEIRGMMTGNHGQLSVPPGFRFHPTDEELLYYYLRKKVSFEAIDLDVIREVDLNRLEPWDLKDKCRIGSGIQNEWYFFSHKDKKYPTGTRTNRATTAGFWKATGRDKAIFHHNNSHRIGMRKTLVFYTGRAPHGQKTDWIMHEYRLEDDNNADQFQQEDGWVVCRVFKKKNHNNNNNRSYQLQEEMVHEEEDYMLQRHIQTAAPAPPPQKQNHLPQLYDFSHDMNNSTLHQHHLHLPQLFSPDHHHHQMTTTPNLNMNSMDVIECSQNLLSLTTTSNGGSCGIHANNMSNVTGDWSFLDKLLASSSSSANHHIPSSHQATIQEISAAAAAAAAATSAAHQKFPFHYLGCDHDILKYSK